MEAKSRVLLLFGGKSVEHEISVRSAKNVYENINKSLFDVFLIGISKSGNWFLKKEVDDLFEIGDPVAIKLNNTSPAIINLTTGTEFTVDVVLPILHGTDGEDGSIQGLFKALNIPLAGSDVTGSALSMDKVLSKKLLYQSGVPVAPYLVFSVDQKSEYPYEKVVDKIGLPFMVKSSALGSSVGINKVTDPESYKEALDDSFQYGDVVLLESFVKGRELECAVLGNEDAKASAPGEIILKKKYDFYNYQAKYQDEEAIDIVIPAKVDAPTQQKIMDLAVQAYKALRCNDFARVDLFLTEDGQVIINEINTIPGFTNVSMFPMLWQQHGIQYTDLITKIIRLSIERHQKNSSFNTSYAKA